MPLAPLVKAHPEPARWREQYAVIEEMRRGLNAPVDTIIERALPAQTRRFHVLISLMLSSQTKDAVTSAAVTNLHLTLPGGLTCTSLAAADRGVVEGCIAKVGFWRRKAEYIQEAARRIEMGEIGDDGSFIGEEGEGSMVGTGKGEIPRTIEGLCALKGVGPKMAYLALQCAWDINAGIGVDVHVHRITNRLKWHRPPTVTPEQTRVNLESWLPRELHKGINPMLVGFGQMICQPVGPRCDICLLGIRKLCPSRVSGVKAEGRKPVLFSYKLDGEGDMEDMIKPDLGPGPEVQGTDGGQGVVPVLDGRDGVGAEGDGMERLVRMKSEELDGSELFLGRKGGVKLEDS
ncbi:DNA glycosylase [Dioszegia hungarica]|uniref:Endonuclease III homolog n=1 Tax=Dioszegia hungarica TaxID=4972 RepID=A0AA38H335_9TREE|nr:DNA glycosylase [Dioszegia hungarica]KAI9633112.1 DNA glycosylase [Dioszegia hungarica]